MIGAFLNAGTDFFRIEVLDYVPAHYRAAIFLRICEKNIHLVSLENMNMIHWIIDVKCLDILFPSQRLNASSLRRHDEGD